MSDHKPNDWQSIESAKRDGSNMWLSDGFFMRIGFWEVHTDNPSHERWVDLAKAEARGPCDLSFVPLYWQLLPSPPR
jgi:hypothetical protein